MRPVNNIVERFIPSTLVFSIVLTSVVAILALILTGTDPADLILHWGEGLADCWPARAPTRATSAGCPEGQATGHHRPLWRTWLTSAAPGDDARRSPLHRIC